MLYVTNRSGRSLSDRWNGMPFTFPPNEKVPVPEEAARHIFGFGEPDRGRAWKRQGFTTRQDGEEFLKSFQFTTDAPKPAEPAPAPQPEVKASSGNEPKRLSDRDKKAPA